MPLAFIVRINRGSSNRAVITTVPQRSEEPPHNIFWRGACMWIDKQFVFVFIRYRQAPHLCRPFAPTRRRSVNVLSFGVISQPKAEGKFFLLCLAARSYR
jgi:hypothetical protein